MPRYEYACEHCGDRMVIRRQVSEMDDPLESPCCGAPMARQFTPGAIHIPLSFRAVLTGGAVGGGQLSWSDFHSVSEKELAHLKDENGRPVEVEHANVARSRPGHGKTTSQQNNRRFRK